MADCKSCGDELRLSESTICKTCDQTMREGLPSLEQSQQAVAPATIEDEKRLAQNAARREQRAAKKEAKVKAKP